MTRGEFARLINPIISMCREIPLLEARKKNILNSNEVVLFLKKIGEPLLEYEKRIVAPSLRMHKKELSRLVQPMSEAYFKDTITPILVAGRKNEGPERFCRYAKTLRTNEVISFLEKIGETLPEETKILK